MNMEVVKVGQEDGADDSMGSADIDRAELLVGALFGCT